LVHEAPADPLNQWYLAVANMRIASHEVDLEQARAACLESIAAAASSMALPKTADLLPDQPAYALATSYQACGNIERRAGNTTEAKAYFEKAAAAAELLPTAPDSGARLPSSLGRDALASAGHVRMRILISLGDLAFEQEHDLDAALRRYLEAEVIV